MTHYAGFWVRAIAKTIDEGLLMLVSWFLQIAGAGLYFWVQTIQGAVPQSENFDAAFNPLWVQVIFFLAYLVISTLYYVYGHAWYGTTLGKKVFSIYVRWRLFTRGNRPFTISWWDRFHAMFAGLAAMKMLPRRILKQCRKSA
jgi:hypothetical protein